jgi:hypothetical protein
MLLQKLIHLSKYLNSWTPHHTPATCTFSVMDVDAIYEIPLSTAWQGDFWAWYHEKKKNVSIQLSWAARTRAALKALHKP